MSSLMALLLKSLDGELSIEEQNQAAVLIDNAVLSGDDCLICQVLEDLDSRPTNKAIVDIPFCFEHALPVLRFKM